MRIMPDLIKGMLKNIFLTLDYIFWLLFDLSKFKIIRTNKIKKVLFFHNGAMGEILVTTPLLKSVKEKLGCEIVFMISKGRERVLEGNPNIDKIIIYDEDFESNLNKLKKENFDLAFIFRASFKFGYLCWKAGIPYRIGGFGGLKRFPSIFFTRRRLPITKYAIESNLDLIRQIGLDNPNPRVEIFIKPIEQKSVEEKLKQLNVNNYFIIHPGFGQAKKGVTTKSWNAKNYAETIDYFVGKYNIKAIVTGVKEEEFIVKDIIAKTKNKKKVINTCGMFSLGELFALIKNARFVIAPDTGTGHAAAALGTPLVNLMSLFSPDFWGPHGERDKIINIYKPRYYELEFPFRIKYGGGINSITSNEVIRAANKLLKGKK